MEPRMNHADTFGSGGHSGNIRESMLGVVVVTFTLFFTLFKFDWVEPLTALISTMNGHECIRILGGDGWRIHILLISFEIEKN